MKNIYRLPETTTPENLECRFFTDSATFLTFGTKTLMAGYYYNGRNANSYYGAVYEFTTDDHSCEGEIRLVAISEELFADNGHAIPNVEGKEDNPDDEEQEVLELAEQSNRRSRRGAGP